MTKKLRTGRMKLPLKLGKSTWRRVGESGNRSAGNSEGYVPVLAENCPSTGSGRTILYIAPFALSPSSSLGQACGSTERHTGR